MERLRETENYTEERLDSKFANVKEDIFATMAYACVLQKSIKALEFPTIKGNIEEIKTFVEVLQRSTKALEEQALKEEEEERKKMEIYSKIGVIIDDMRVRNAIGYYNDFSHHHGWPRINKTHICNISLKKLKGLKAVGAITIEKIKKLCAEHDLEMRP